MSNAKIAKILRNVAAAYTIKKIGNIFQIRAYENAADSIEHSTAEIQDLWQEGKLSEVPNLGEKLQEYINELLETGKVKHFESVQKGIPPVVFELLDIPGVGPKTAEKLALLGVKDLADLRKKIKTGELVEKGFSAKIAQSIMLGLQHLNQAGKRMLLPYAAAQADKI
ncbi:MAG: helix-hairpin-helix domain-containing protein, partial [Patescibacteria group bacterium]|nr:helix-hairpin-helix domain-containing protein [Patescibacteria group bacterium]